MHIYVSLSIKPTNCPSIHLNRYSQEKETAFFFCTLNLKVSRYQNMTHTVLKLGPTGAQTLAAKRFVHCSKEAAGCWRWGLALVCVISVRYLPKYCFRIALNQEAAAQQQTTAARVWRRNHSLKLWLEAFFFLNWDEPAEPKQTVINKISGLQMLKPKLCSLGLSTKQSSLNWDDLVSSG